VGKDKPIKYEETSEIIDGGNNSLSESMLRRLKIIESALKSVVAKLGKADMTSRFKQLNELHRNLGNCINSSSKQKESMKYLVELETAIAEALKYLSNSKMAARFNLLKELRQELENAIDKSRNNDPLTETQQA
jgi:5'-3' exonuclease